MTTQITVRLPDELVEFMDTRISAHQDTSRAALITRALEHERRSALIRRDVEILTSTSDYDFEGLPAVASRTPMDDLD